ncbi:uncharacterized protein PHALS_15434 [Plasmopara halstedii]|uniref:Uncharacterized protein n=1 Tax=Plasmopara halstedii TaxID=4781 RepID=A0A0P1AH96_PLAHL|nr:uncharacterized protein PHALS_15434 [Plasmopara halstedii]CEG40265.1 hypothetical protein PHALS_15434 [Plasmopara halstedii]|eukprot:XP_024576634.1 hypothetical protein PHALS_15434 [Plasmopara halstedii]
MISVYYHRVYIVGKLVSYRQHVTCKFRTRPIHCKRSEYIDFEQTQILLLVDIKHVINLRSKILFVHQNYTQSST